MNPNSHILLPHFAFSAMRLEYRETHVATIGDLFYRQPQFYPAELLADPGYYDCFRRIGYSYCTNVAENMKRHQSVSNVPMIRIGSEYGGWWMVDGGLSESSTVYGCGVGQDTTWDEGVIERFGCTVYGFDPTPPGLRHGKLIAQRNPKFIFVPTGVWSADAEVSFYSPPGGTGSLSLDNIHGRADVFRGEVRKVSSLMRSLGNGALDVIKLDIEGAAHDVVESMIADQITPNQVLLEFDMPVPPWTVEKTLRTLLGGGYVCTRVEGLNFSFARAEMLRAFCS